MPAVEEQAGMVPAEAAPLVAAASASVTEAAMMGGGEVAPATMSKDQAYRARKRELLGSPGYKEDQANARRIRRHAKEGPSRPYTYKGTK